MPAGSASIAPTSSAGLDLYLAYTGYLTAHQLSRVITLVDDTYAVLARADDFRENGLHWPDAARLRVQRVETGDSISLSFLPGVEQVVEFLGTSPVAVGGSVALGAVGVLFHLVSRIQRAQIGSAAVRTEKAKAEIAETAAAVARLGLRSEDLAAAVEEQAVQVLLTQTALGLRGPDEASVFASRLRRPILALDQVLNSENVTRATINGQDVVPPRDGSDSAALRRPDGA